jgi:hypothetical protein
MSVYYIIPVDGRLGLAQFVEDGLSTAIEYIRKVA